MDAFDFQDEQKSGPQKPPPFGLIFNLVTVLLLILMLCMIGFFALTFINPANPFNPFPPDPTMTQWVSPTLRSTKTPTLVPTTTSTKAPTLTKTVTATATEVTQIFTAQFTASNTPEPSATPAEDILFVIQPGTPKFLDSTIFNPDLGCNFLGVAGQVFDNTGTPLRGIIVEISGMLGTESILQITTTGGATQYGPGGFEFNLATEPIASQGSLTILLKDVAGEPISDPTSINTSAECTENLVMINFVQR